MATTIKDGDTTTQDASEALVYTFDYDALGNLAAGIQLSSVGTVSITPTSGLTSDNATLAANGRSVTVRISGGVKDKVYEVRHTVSTNEAPAQTKSKWFHLRIT